MEVARRTSGRWKPGHPDIKTQIVIERGGAVLLRFNIDELDEIEQMAHDLLREVAELRSDLAMDAAWLEKNPAPNSQELIAKYGNSDSIPKQAWDEYFLAKARWWERRKLRTSEGC
jgi:hypothetical protein